MGEGGGQLDFTLDLYLTVAFLPLYIAVITLCLQSYNNLTILRKSSKLLKWISCGQILVGGGGRIHPAQIFY